MKYTKLSDLEVSVVGLGCNVFGRDIGSSKAQLVVDAAIDSGITFFDTADSYGSGQSEGILASALGSHRNDVVIATKFGRPIDGESETGGGHPKYVAQAVERSLKELGRDWIDLYQYHKPDPLVPLEETLGAMLELVDQGKVRSIGCSQFSSAQVEESSEISDAARRRGFVSIQTEYSIVNREPEKSGLVDACIRHGVGILPYRPMAKGLLSGRMRPGDTPTRQLSKERFQRFLTDDNFDVVDAMRDLARRHDRHPAEAAIRWLLDKPGVVSVFPGATKPEQVQINAHAADWDTEPSTFGVFEMPSSRQR